MGTNFHARHIPTEKEHKNMLESLKNKNYEKLKEELSEYTKTWHIGKRSCGWQFLFSPHRDKQSPWKEEYPWEDKLDSIKNFLNKSDIIIEDEYGQQFTPEQFWNEEIGNSLYNDPEKFINGHQYDEKYPHHSISGVNSFEYTTEEGLRFSKTSDFF